MWLNDLARTTRNSLLDFLWRQWTQMGVSGTATSCDEWVIDPEALLLFTMEVGRFDPRLFDEVVDWIACNERWISLQRLKNLTESWDADVARRAMVAVARFANSVEKRNRWRAISIMEIRSDAEPVPFFLDADGNPFPVTGMLDEFFSSVGLLRPPVVIRRMSRRVPMNAGPGMILKLRSLFGLGPRAEVVAYLLTHGSAGAAEIARAAGYSRPPVQEALNDLVEGGFVLVSRRNKQKSYSVDVERWKTLIETGEPLPRWVAWPRVFQALSGLLAFLMEIENRELSDYMLRSRLLTQSEHLRDELALAGIANPFVRPLGLDDAPEEFERRVGVLLDSLHGGGG